MERPSRPKQGAARKTFGWRPAGMGAPRDVREGGGAARVPAKAPLSVFTTTLWEYSSQHYDAPGSAMQGDAKYAGATPSWVIWQLLQRYTKPGERVLDPMCGSGTTLDVCRDLGREGLGCDLAPARPDIRRADARDIPLDDATVDFVFVDPPYSTHIDYSDDPACIGKLHAGEARPAGPHPNAYYAAMARVIGEVHRVLRPDRYMALYVSDSFDKGKAGARPPGHFMPIGFELFAMMRGLFTPVDIVSVVRGNDKLARGHWHKAAAAENFFLRGFNYLFIMHKPAGGQHAAARTPGRKGRA